MLRQILFQIHWALGVTVGLFLAVIGVTGAMMSFEDEIMAALSQKASAVVVRDAPRLTVPQLAARFVAEHPKGTLSALIVEADPNRMAQAKYASGMYDESALRQQYLDPYDAHVAGQTVGRGFFVKVRQIHRWLLLPEYGRKRHSMGAGRWATMVTSFSLIFFALSGLYLRWPRRPLDWRAWFKLDFRMTGRNLYRSLHAIIGGWVLAVYLISAVTGLWWSFGDLRSWYRDGVATVLTGQPYIEGDGDGGVGLPDLTKAWAGFQAVRPGGYQRVTIEIRDKTAPVRFRVLPIGARHNRAWDVIKVDPGTGQVVSNDPYGLLGGKQVPTGEFIVTNMMAIHMGGFFGLPGRIVLMAAAGTMPLFAITGLLLYFDRRTKKKALRALTADAAAGGGDGSLLVIYATQTRTAERLARQTAAAFAAAGRSADVLSIDGLNPATLAKAKTALFVASTYGDGEPPDSARGFVRRHLAEPTKLEELGYAVLALGDREYAQFCSFGHRIDLWLETSGAHRLFGTVEVDGEDETPIEAWRQGIAALGAASDAVRTEAVVYDRWRLVERRLLNPGSPGAPAFHVSLEPLGEFTHWQAGDIAVILPGYASPEPADADASLSFSGGDGELLTRPQRDLHAPAASTKPTLPPREYSIASTPTMGRIEFIVRQVQKDDGQFGLGSGWLTRHVAVGDEVLLRLRSNPAFHAPAEPRRTILIGNGTGLAGLLAHIRQRAAGDAGPTWLLFGERSQAHDRFHGEELDGHVATGALTRIDCAFSRDEGDGRYVQDAIVSAGDEIRRWVDEGAAIYVCGSLKGMAPQVDRRLRDILGDQRLDELTDAGLYRRDIY